jgi:hypothetical protein
MKKLPPLKTGRQVRERAMRMAKLMENLSREELIDMTLVAFSASGHFLQFAHPASITLFRVRLPDLAADYLALAEYFVDAAESDQETLEKKIREDRRNRN